MCLINNAKGVFLKTSKKLTAALEGACTQTLTRVSSSQDKHQLFSSVLPRVLTPSSVRLLMQTPHFFLPASMYTEIQRERPDGGNILTHPDYVDGNPDLIKPKKLLNPVKASKSHQELHRELLMNHKR